MKITLLFLLISFNISAQYLSLSQTKIVSNLNKQRIEFSVGVTPQGDEFLYVANINNCSFKYIFDINDICRKEIITTNSKENADMIMDLDTKHYIKLNNVYHHEEEYGLVEVNVNENVFTFTYE